MQVYIYIYICVMYMCVYIHIYMYIYMRTAVESERGRIRPSSARQVVPPKVTICELRPTY